MALVNVLVDLVNEKNIGESLILIIDRKGRRMYGFKRI